MNAPNAAIRVWQAILAAGAAGITRERAAIEADCRIGTLGKIMHMVHAQGEFWSHRRGVTGAVYYADRAAYDAAVIAWALLMRARRQKKDGRVRVRVRPKQHPRPRDTRVRVRTTEQKARHVIASAKSRAQQKVITKKLPPAPFRANGLTVKPALVPKARGPAGMPGDPIITAATIRTILPSAPVYSRHQVLPGTRIVGGFATMGMGRYLDEEMAA